MSIESGPHTRDREPHSRTEEPGHPSPESPQGSARPIRVLTDQVVDQIAAGEVVERPASVVKELVENALDAGASHITVEVELGGKRLIRVVDNGCGMSPHDARTALLRHATSKLSRLEDIFSLTTMGFRGEALPSIAAVSRMLLTTRARSHLSGTRLTIDGGTVTGESEVGTPVGTQVEVRDLLYNVPARLKFLKGNATEASHVTDAVTRLAMAHPHVLVRLRHGSRTSLEAPQHKSRLERVRALLSNRFARGVHRASGEEAGIVVDAYLTAPELAQTTSRGVQFYVGRRPVRDRGLLQATAMGYGELLPKGRYPVVVLFIDVPDGAVDVNVHPQKQEVRFSDPQAVFAAVRHVVRRGVARAPWLADRADHAGSPVRMRAIASTRPPARSGHASTLAARHAADTTRSLFAPADPEPERQSTERIPPTSREHASPPARPEAPSTDAPMRETAFPLAPAAPASGGPPGGDDVVDRYRPGAYGSGASRASERRTRWPYTLGGRAADSGQESVASDEPAAAPDAPAEALPEATSERDVAPAAIDADPDAGARREASTFFSDLRYIGQLDRTYLVCESRGEMVLVDQHAAHERVAFERLRERYKKRDIPVQRALFAETVELGPEQVAVLEDHRAELGKVGFEIEPADRDRFALTTVPAGLRPGDAPSVLVELLSELAERGGSRALDDRLDLALATIACHSVVRAGDPLSPREVESLFESLDQVDFKAHCPHGRPVLLRISVSEIARRFGRT